MGLHMGLMQEVEAISLNAVRAFLSSTEGRAIIEAATKDVLEAGLSLAETAEPALKVADPLAQEGIAAVVSLEDKGLSALAPAPAAPVSIPVGSGQSVTLAGGDGSMKLTDVPAAPVAK